MTRKDYKLIADALRAVIVESDGGRRAGAEACTQRIADALQADNPRFDRERFLIACGVDA